MLNVFNGVFKDNCIIVDVVQVDPADYKLNKDFLWFDIGVSVFAVGSSIYDLSSIGLSDFHFYIADSEKNILNPISINEEFDYEKKENGFSILVGFEFKPDFFYHTPTFGFYFEKYKKVELIPMIR